MRNDLTRRGREANGWRQTLPGQVGRPNRSGFTLIEVVLAMAIAVGILAVVLFFYRQSELLRNQLLAETSRISAARLVLERLTFELGTAVPGSDSQTGLTGGSDTLQFCRLDWPGPAAWTNRLDSTNAQPWSPLRRVTYALVQDTNSARLSGIARSEQAGGERSLASESVLGGTNGPASGSMPVDQLGFLRFRYWSGTIWTDAWSSPNLPAGVEVSVGAEPLPIELIPEEYPFELFRRVVFIPRHGSQAASANSGPTDGKEAL